MHENVEPRREDKDDHDLLTYGEAGVRVFEEIKAQRQRVRELDESGADAADLATARARLTALQDAAERNRRRPINDDNFEQFFGYKGTARRNT